MMEVKMEQTTNTMNGFDVLPDEMVENIMSLLKVHDLLKLTEVCKRFNEVFLASEKLLGKIQFDMSTERSSRNFREIPEMIQSRAYKALKIKYIKISDDVCVGEESEESFYIYTFVSFSTLKLHESLSLIRLKVLTLDNCTVTYQSIANLLKVVLPNLRLLALIYLVITDIPADPTASDIDGVSNLESLSILDSVHILLPFFRNFTKLRTFCVAISTSLTDFNLAKDLIADFLREQTKLQILSLQFGRRPTAEFDLMNSSWNFQLKHLALAINFNWVGLNEFLLKHRNVESIDFYNASGNPELPSLLATICQMRNLKEIAFNDHCVTAFEGLKDLKNDSVERIEFLLFGDVKVHGRMFSMFPNLKSIEIGCADYETDNTRLYCIPHHLLKLIKVKERLPIQFLYRVDEVPSDLIAFERDVTNFLEKHSEVIFSVEIGTPAWNNVANFSLSMNFCKNFINLPNLSSVVLYKACDKQCLNTFYSLNVDQGRLEGFQLK